MAPGVVAVGQAVPPARQDLCWQRGLRGARGSPVLRRTCGTALWAAGMRSRVCSPGQELSSAARQVLSLRVGTAPLPRSAALFCAGTLSTSSAPAPCSSTTGCVCLRLQRSSLRLASCCPVPVPCSISLSPAPMSALTPQDLEAPLEVGSCALGRCAGQSPAGQVGPRGRAGAPGGGAAVGGEPAASDVTAVHGG